MKAAQIFAIGFRRLPRVGRTPGLVALAIHEAGGAKPPRKLGALTDAALRGRLAHWNLHSANEVAAIRQALGPDDGQVTVHEAWAGLGNCLQYWHDFTGSHIRAVEWTCEGCSTVNRENVGSSVGETYSRACKCGKVKRITTTSYIPQMR
jgi:hypothetical protein